MISEVKKLKIELNKLIRAWFLQNNKRDLANKLFCPLKKKWYEEDMMQVSHFIDRAVMSTRYHRNNLLLCSKQSNVWDAKIPSEGHRSRHHRDYARYLGREKVEQLLTIAKANEIPDIADLRNYIKFYTVHG